MGKLYRWLVSRKAKVSEEGFDEGPETNKEPRCISGNSEGFHDRPCFHEEVGGWKGKVILWLMLHTLPQETWVNF